MTNHDLRKRASWLNGVAQRVQSPEVSKLLRQYARAMTREADSMDDRETREIGAPSPSAARSAAHWA